MKTTRVRVQMINLSRRKVVCTWTSEYHLQFQVNTVDQLWQPQSRQEYRLHQVEKIQKNPQLPSEEVNRPPELPLQDQQNFLMWITWTQKATGRVWLYDSACLFLALCLLVSLDSIPTMWGWSSTLAAETGMCFATPIYGANPLWVHRWRSLWDSMTPVVK